jgi:hypothetical protein
MQDKLSPEDPENPEAKWVDPQEVSALLTHPKDKEFYENIKPRVLDFIAARSAIPR